MAKEVQIVRFQVGRESFGLPIGRVHEIVRPPAITPVPQSPNYVEGVINLRGRIVPVIDLRKRFGQPASDDRRRNRVLIVSNEGKPVGLMVDSASEVLKVPETEIEDAPKVFGGDESNYVTGVAKHQGRLIILVDLEKILRPAESRRLQHTEAPA